MGSFGGIEAGGTKFICAAGSGPDDFVARSIPTTTPAETIARVQEFFVEHRVESLGVGCFGPIDIASGRITTTPKEGWRDFAILEALRRATGIERIVFDTDVNAAAMGEYTWGAARGVDSLIYLTVGTGVGGGAIVEGKRLHGLSHPEMGHIRIPHDHGADPFPGACYAHGDCFEGLASGLAMERRWGRRGEELPPSHAAWDLEIGYLAHGLASLICVLSPRKVIIGGSVMRGISMAALRAKTADVLNGYIELPEIVAPELGDRAGVLGAIALAASG